MEAKEKDTQWAIAHPVVNAQFPNRASWHRYLAAYAAARSIRPFDKINDTGATMDYMCRECNAGHIRVRVCMTQLPRGYLKDNPSIVVYEATKCECGVPLKIRSFSEYLGRKFDTRANFTALGNFYFRGRQYSRNDCGKSITYSCLACSKGKFKALLEPGKTENGKTKWVAHLNVVVATDCDKTCVRSEKLNYSDPVQCDVCLGEDAESPVTSLCCLEKHLCRPCLQGMALTCPPHLMNLMSDGDEDNTGATNRGVIRFNPTFPIKNNDYYFCLYGCDAKWTRCTLFNYSGLQADLQTIVRMPIGFDSDRAYERGSELELETAIAAAEAPQPTHETEL